jgi:hypothetical protein
MPSSITIPVSDRGEITLPREVCETAGIAKAATVEVQEGVVVIRPYPGEVEIYSSERKAEFLLNNAVDEADYAAAREAVRRMGLDPDGIEHARPTGN